MLKSIEFIKRLKGDLDRNKHEGNIKKYFIELKINNNVDIYIVSNSIKALNDLKVLDMYEGELENKNLNFKFLTLSQAEDDEFKYLFDGEEISFGLRRSLNALLSEGALKKEKSQNVVTFYSYKGGVGRTTSLALTATYLARKGMNVFVMDFDFEAPGLINFFRSSQVDAYKSGIVEYLNDRLFTSVINIEDYVYSIEKTYSGNGVINLMPAGNVISGNEEDLQSYLEGLAKVDFQGLRLISIFEELLKEVKLKFNPDVILMDSRTGFNNVFGALIKNSSHVVVLAGDDIQNQPGVSYVSKALKEANVRSSFVLSILSGSFTRRFNNFEKQIQSYFNNDADVFYFDRHAVLEFIGTSMDDDDDLNDFINGDSGSAQYTKFFSYIESILRNGSNLVPANAVMSAPEVVSNERFLKGEKFEVSDVPEKPSAKTELQSEEVNQDLTLQDKILNIIKNKLPNLYAETIDYTEEYINKEFYIRPCMEDLFIQEKVILLGDKGTGKTAFYKALQNDFFFSRIVERSQKKHLNFKVFNITDFENDSFEFLKFDSYIKDELFIKKFWMFYIWNALVGRGGFGSKNSNSVVDLSKTTAIDKIIQLVSNNDLYSEVEEELMQINNKLRGCDSRLIITFDRLDNIVKPFLWNDIVSPLIKLCMRSPWANIQPKLFLRRDLYERLGNLTNKSSFDSRIINLEWSQNEMFSYFLKIVFTSCKEEFLKFLGEQEVCSPNFISSIRQKLKSRSVEHNQLPLETHIIEPIINCFFGMSRPRKNGKISTAYEDLYRNIQSADKTVNLRPFLDLMTHAIQDQEEKDAEKQYRKQAILGLAYCTSSHVRKEAVVRYLIDLWNEQGNEFVKFFCQAFSNNKVNSRYKRNALYEDVFEDLLTEIKGIYKEESVMKTSSIEDLKQILIANKIITPFMVGNKTRYGFAYLYTNYLGI